MNKAPGNRKPKTGETEFNAHRRPWKVASLVCFMVLLILSFVLRLVTTAGFVYPPRRPAVALELPYLMIQLAAQDSGLHCIAMRERAVRLKIHIRRATHLGVSGYHHSRQVALLGFAAAILPRTFHDGDSIQSPYAAFVLPYWFLIGSCSLAVVLLTGLGQAVRPYCRISTAGCAVMGLVMAGFLVANLVPARNDSGPSTSEGGEVQVSPWLDRYRMCFAPGSYPEIALDYGFPVVCYGRAFIKGSSVKVFHGADTLGWRPHLLMENVCLALLATAVAGMGIEWLRSWRQTRLPDKREDNDG